MAKKIKIVHKQEHKKQRAVELYCNNTPFTHRVERDKTKYTRKAKYKHSSEC